MPTELAGTSVDPPDPGGVRDIDELIKRLRALKMWAGSPSYETITSRINAAWTGAGRPASERACRGTVVDCFRLGRRRLNTDLVIAVVAALRPDPGYVAQWHQALRVVLGEARASALVRAQDTLPADLPEFTGRDAELDELRQTLRRGGESDHTGTVWAIEGMAGVGKTQFAVHAGHVLAAEEPFEQVLFVNLRGFHPDPTAPPADPAAVLDSFLRLLGVPGQRIPHDPAARAALYRRRLAGKRALVVLDNAADESQVRPLLPADPTCLTLVTSRRRLPALRPAIHVAMDVFTQAEARDFLRRAAPGVPAGDDPSAGERVTNRCGYLPLALGLVAARMRATPGWTYTDHADRLDERHHNRRLDSGITLALDVSYLHLPARCRLLFRLLTLHPGQYVDQYAAAALTGTDPDTAHDDLHRLAADHLLQQPAPDRYALHDLVRAYGADRSAEEDRPPERRAAEARLADYYLCTAAAAMDTVYPAERDRRPRILRPAANVPTVTDPAAAWAWLEAQHPDLIALALHAADRLPAYTIGLSATLYRYLDSTGHLDEPLALHIRAARAAELARDPGSQANALINVGSALGRMGRCEEAAEPLQQALVLYREIGDRRGEARALSNLGIGHWLSSRYREAGEHLERAVFLYRETGDRLGEARALDNLGLVEWRLGRYQQAMSHRQRALEMCREAGDRIGEARALNNLGLVYERLGHYRTAADQHRRALAICREVGDKHGVADALTNLGVVHLRQGDFRRAADHHRQALTLFREIDNSHGECEALNGLGEALIADGQPDQARANHTTALAVASRTGERYEQARAHSGIAKTHAADRNTDEAHRHWRQALDIFNDLDVPEAEEIGALMTGQRTPPYTHAR